MIYSTSVQKLGVKYFAFWSMQNWQICRYIVVNSATFQISKLYQILSFLCILDYLIFFLKICRFVEYIIAYT
jgi:hypothetical protein